MNIFSGNLQDEHDKCSRCGRSFGNAAYHESICGKVDVESREDRVKKVSKALIELSESNNRKSLDYTLDKQVNLGLVFKSDHQRIKELEEENTKLRQALIEVNDKLYKVSRKFHRANDDSYNDITPDRDDYR